MNITKIISKTFDSRLKQIDLYASQASEIQHRVLSRLVNQAAQTEWGKKYDYASIRSYEDFRNRLPIQTYEEIKPYVERLRAGEQNLLWPSEIRWFAKSSGTTNDKSKFLPVSKEALEDIHYRGGKDAAALYFRINPDSHFFSGKGLILGGSHSPNLNSNHSLVGDLSAILIQNVNPLINFIRVPSKKIALMSEWETKIEAIANSTIPVNVTSGTQNDLSDPAMLLMVDYGIFYEFIPLEEVDKENPRAYCLEEVELNKNYAMVISTSCGLWRYMIGDTVKFTSKNPYKFVITGRTKHFINAFGEELIVDNAEKGLAKACAETGAQVSEYSAAPVFMDEHAKCRHQWLIEFAKMPDSVEKFAAILDATLKEVNSDYEAKRWKDIALQPLEVIVARPGLFHDWLAQKGKLGGQHKVPRLSNTREYIESMLVLNNE